jgi:taurine dioxygenase
MPLQIRRLSHTLGAEISGIDLRKPLDEKSFHAIHTAFLEHCVLLFRGQPLTREQHVAFSRWFGDLAKYEDKSAAKRVPDFPEIYLVVSKPKPNGEPSTERYTGADWHTDHSHLPAPAQASLLRSVQIPEVGGDTQFANMYFAYDTLSDGMKKLLDGLYGVHMEGVAVIDHSTPERYAESRRRNLSTAHPIVRVHPETGRKALYVSEQVKLLVGMTPGESKPIIQYLTRHATRPQGVYRHVWQKDDLVMWDNRCLMHIALADYDRAKVRHMERTTVNGTAACGYAYDGPLE